MTFTRPGARARTAGSVPKMSVNRDAPLLVNRHLHSLEFLRLLLRQRVSREHARADLAAGQKLQTASHSIRGVQLDVQVGLRMRVAIGGRLMEDHDVRKRPLPE